MKQNNGEQNTNKPTNADEKLTIQLLNETSGWIQSENRAKIFR